MLREHNCQGMPVFSKEPFPMPAAWKYYLKVDYRPALTVIAVYHPCDSHLDIRERGDEPRI
jgi:hypothetical protein